MKGEKQKLCQINNELRESNQLLRQNITELNSTVHRIEEEKQSLLTALKLLQKQVVEPESNKRTQDLENENKSLLAALEVLQNESPDTRQRKWSTVKTKRDHKSQTNKATELKATEVYNIETKNQYTILSDSDDENESLIKAQTTHQSQEENPNQAIHNNAHTTPKHRESQSQHHTRKNYTRNQPKTAILGDSVIKHLNTRRMQDGLKNEKVFIKTFSGTGFDEMKHYVVPTLNTKPKKLISFILEQTTCRRHQKINKVHK